MGGIDVSVLAKGIWSLLSLIAFFAAVVFAVGFVCHGVAELFLFGWSAIS